MSADKSNPSSPETIIQAAVGLYTKYGAHGQQLFSAEVEKELAVHINNLGDISVAALLNPERMLQEFTPEKQARLDKLARDFYNLLVTSLPGHLKPAPLV